MKVCKKCQSINADNSSFCTKCGAPLGSSLHNGAATCQRPVSKKTQRPSFRGSNASSCRQSQSSVGSKRQSQRAMQRPLPSNNSPINPILIGIACVIGVLFLIGVFSSSSSSSTSSSSSDYYVDRSSSASNSMVTCPLCWGSGKNNSPDIFKSQMACWACNGSGQVRASDIEKLIPSDPKPQKGLCSACGGSGSCPSCKVTGGGVRYADIKYCSTCGGTGKCKWCYGSGIQQ